MKITFNTKFFLNFIQIKSIKWLGHRCHSKKFGTFDCRSVSKHFLQLFCRYFSNHHDTNFSGKILILTLNISLEQSTNTFHLNKVLVIPYFMTSDCTKIVTQSLMMLNIGYWTKFGIILENKIKTLPKMRA